MKDHDLRVLAYLSIMTLIISCVGIIYGLVFFNQQSSISLENTYLTPQLIIVAGVIVAALNSVAANIVSDFLLKSITNLSKNTKIYLSSLAFLLTLGASIILALMSTSGLLAK